MLKISTAEVIKIGRSRCGPASSSAVSRLIPARRRSFVRSTSRIAFFPTSPNSAMIPMKLGTLSVCPNTSRPRNAPTDASGSAVRIKTGWSQLS